MGIFWLRNPLFLILGISTPAMGKRIPNYRATSVWMTSTQTPLTPTRSWPVWPDFDLNLTQFWLQIALGGQNQAHFRSKSGREGGQNRVGVSGVWGWGSLGRSRSVAPRKVVSLVWKEGGLTTFCNDPLSKYRKFQPFWGATRTTRCNFRKPPDRNWVRSQRFGGVQVQVHFLGGGGEGVSGSSWGSGSGPGARGEGPGGRVRVRVRVQVFFLWGGGGGSGSHGYEK